MALDRPSVAGPGGGGSSPRSDGRLIQFLIDHPAPAFERQVFVNRTLRMESIRTIGFDLDWTLADYERLPLERLTMELTVKRLIDHFKYPEEIRKVEFRPDFPRRGLLIDKQAGTVINMSRHRYVNRAFFGRQSLDRRELKRLYRYEPIDPAADRFYHLDSLFELPEANLYAELIELGHRDAGLALPDWQRTFEDVRAAIDCVHGRGALKQRIVADLPRYLRKDRQMALALRRLALGGRKMVLLTNSDWRYTRAVCDHLFEGLVTDLGSWRDLFDLVVVSAGKPAFFRADRPFTQLEEEGEPQAEVEIPAWGGLYSGGSLDGLMHLIATPGEQVLYVGDHIYGDVVSSKLRSTWRTALIVRELEEELRTRAAHRREIAQQIDLKRRLGELGARMDRLRDLVRLADDQAGVNGWNGPEAAARRAELKKLTGEHRLVLRKEAHASDRIAAVFNPYWGSFFKQGTSKTRFASQLEAFACLYTSRLSNFAYYGSQNYFRVAEDPMMHELEEPREGQS